MSVSAAVHVEIPQEVALPLTFSGQLGGHVLQKKPSVHAGCGGFSGSTQ